MLSQALLAILLLVTARKVCSFEDECDSLESNGVRIRTKNLIVDTSIWPPLTDPHRYTRNITEEGHVQYVSEKGFDSLILTGYVYFSPENHTEWGLQIKSGNKVQTNLPNLLRINKRNLHHYEKKWPSLTIATSWHSFTVNITLTDCPKVIEVWLRGYASENIRPGWALQVGQINLHENHFSGCVVPECFQPTSENCGIHATTAQQQEKASAENNLYTIKDDVSNFSQVFLATRNLVIESANAISSFNGDAARIRRNTTRKGILTYAIAEGITSIEVTLYKCMNHNSSLTLTPYLTPNCKPLQVKPDLVHDAYHSNCWRRYKAKFQFQDLMECPPNMVDISISGGQKRALQIAKVVLTGYGPTHQDPGFTARINDGDDDGGGDSPPVDEENEDSIHETGSEPRSYTVDNTGGADSELNERTLGSGHPNSNDGRASTDSDAALQLKYWIPVIAIGMIFVVIIIIGFLLVRNEKARDYFKEYVSERYPEIYDYFFATNQQSPTPKAARSVRMCDDAQEFGSESLNMGSLTFDHSLKKKKESTSQGKAITRDCFGEQLIDLSKHLHRSFWTSKVGGKSEKVEIEERLGKGGFGKVWKARWQGTLVALKVVPIHGSLTGEEKATKMAIMEAALSGCLAHPNIVSTYTCEIRESSDFDLEMQGTTSPGESEKKWMSFERFAQTNVSKSFLKYRTKTDLEVRIIMEYCDRGSLVEAIRNGWFRKLDNPNERDFEAILLTALDIARGLGCLHQNNVIHGDLKPHNVLLQNKPFVDTRGFIAKIADFGLSIRMEQEQSHVDGMRMGTGGYVSPEVAVRGKILPASDIYSYGILLWEIFTGELIQDAIKDAPKVSSRLTMGSWRPIFQEDCPRPYWRLASMCWNDFPDWRPTLEYIIDELNNMLKDLHNPMKANEASTGSVIKEENEEEVDKDEDQNKIKIMSIQHSSI